MIRKHYMILTLGVVACGSGLSVMLDDVPDDPLARYVSSAELAGVVGGATCYQAWNAPCPQSFNHCNSCAKVGDPCGGNAYNQITTHYRSTKQGRGGKKGDRIIPGSTAVLCGDTINCGPSCVAAQGNVICPSNQIGDFQTEREPDPNSDDCAPVAQLEEENGQTYLVGIFDTNGGHFNAFTMR